MLVLAVDTSTPQGAVALVRDGSLLAETTLKLDSHHSTHVLPAAQWLFDLTGTTIENVDLFACARGPGSFTGLRIGLATCIGLATGVGKPAVGVSSLHCVAYPYAGSGRLVAALIDARKSQVYFQLFRGMGVRGLAPLGDPVSITPERLPDYLSDETILVGGGVDLYREKIEIACGTKALLPPAGLCYHKASVVAQLAEILFQEGVVEVEPLYVRASDAELNMEGK